MIFTLITIVHLYLQNSAKCYYTVVIKLILKLFQMKKSFASYYKSLATEKEKKKYWCCWRLGKNRMHIFNLNENLILGCQVWKWNPATNQTHINPLMMYLTLKKQYLNLLKVKHIYFFIVISICICICKITVGEYSFKMNIFAVFAWATNNIDLHKSQISRKCKI